METYYEVIDSDRFEDPFKFTYSFMNVNKDTGNIHRKVLYKGVSHISFTMYISNVSTSDCYGILMLPDYDKYFPFLFNAPGNCTYQTYKPADICGEAVTVFNPSLNVLKEINIALLDANYNQLSIHSYPYAERPRLCIMCKIVCKTRITEI